jgi:hypothetical protein
MNSMVLFLYVILKSVERRNDFMIVKHYCPFCGKLIKVEKVIGEDRRRAKIVKENVKTICKVLGKSCENIHR